MRCLRTVLPVALLFNGLTQLASAQASRDPYLGSFRFRSIGPASMGGRIDDVEVAPTNHSIIYIGFATGGAFKSVNNGTTFEPIFDNYTTSSIGDIAIHPRNADVVYIGTGEANNRQSSSFGDGIYKSTDGGKTFAHVGLRETQTIARILIDPRNPEIVYVAAPGHLFGPSTTGGMYKSTDGGKSWTQIKYIDENTGFTDVVMDPKNSRVLYASSYQRRRLACCFNGGGPGSALWKSTDGGAQWTKLQGPGLPPGPYGRIAIDVSPSDPNVVYAQIEAGSARLTYPPGSPGAEKAAATAAAQRPAPGVAVMPPNINTTPGGDAARYWCSNGDLPDATEDALPTGARPLLDPTQGGVFRSSDGGRTWTPKSNCNERPMYFSQVRVDPTDPNTVYTSGGRLAISRDAGVTFEKLEVVHSDNHALWIDPKDPKHLIAGNDGGVNMSYDQGRTWDFVNTLATAQTYSVTADNERPYNLYTGLQDNGNWGGPSTSRARVGILNSDWFKLPCVGDGFVTAVNRDNPNIVYCEGQDGSLQRSDLSTGSTRGLRPVPGITIPTVPVACNDGRSLSNPRLAHLGTRGGRATVLNSSAGDLYRFHWNTPFILSPHDPNIVYVGGNRLFKSYDRGDTWVSSADLTKQVDRCKVVVMGVRGDEDMLAENDGIEYYSTIVSVAESRVMPGVVWAGTDDGNLQVSRDGGLTFIEVGRNLPGLPRNHDYFPRIDASHFAAGMAYIAVDGHNSDDMKPYVFVTRDYGATFQSITNDLPAYGNVRVIREDPKNKDLLFVGTEFGLYASTDGGVHWKKFMNDFPTVRVDDILIHPREGDLIVATHGRSLLIADDITALQRFTPAVAAQDAFLFEPRTAVAWVTDLTANPYLGGARNFAADNAPAGAAISYYLKAAADDVKIAVTDASGRMVGTMTGPRTAGIHKLAWSALKSGERATAPRVEAGVYQVSLATGGKTLVRTLTILEDKWFKAR